MVDSRLNAGWSHSLFCSNTDNPNSESHVSAVLVKACVLRVSAASRSLNTLPVGARCQGGNKTPVLSGWIGYWVSIACMSGPNLDTDDPAKPVREQPEAVTASFLLEDYGPLGLEVKRNPTDPTNFMSWGGVLYVQGPPPEVRKQIDEQTAGQGGQRN